MRGGLCRFARGGPQDRLGVFVPLSHVRQECLVFRVDAVDVVEQVDHPALHIRPKCGNHPARVPVILHDVGGELVDNIIREAGRLEAGREVFRHRLRTLLECPGVRLGNDALGGVSFQFLGQPQRGALQALLFRRLNDSFQARLPGQLLFREQGGCFCPEAVRALEHTAMQLFGLGEHIICAPKKYPWSIIHQHLQGVIREVAEGVAWRPAHVGADEEFVRRPHELLRRVVEAGRGPDVFRQVFGAFGKFLGFQLCRVAPELHTFTNIIFRLEHIGHAREQFVANFVQFRQQILGERGGVIF